MSPKCNILFLMLILSIDAQAPCPAGQGLKNGVCKLCPPGTYSRISDRICIKCPKGKFQPTSGVEIQELCRPCRPDTFSDIRGAISCKPCPDGQRSATGSKKCIRCERGTVFREYSNGCRSCDSGQYEQDGECKDCRNGLSSKRAATSIDECKPCEELQNCPKCSKGTFRIGINCIVCPPGFITRREGATDPSECVPCPAGTFLKTRFEGCRPCGKGFASAPGATRCRNPKKPCPKGTFETKNKNCMKCESGFRYDPKTKACIMCAEDEGSPGGLTRACTKCAPDKVKDQFDGRCKCGAGTFLAKDKTCTKCPPGTKSFAGSNRCTPCSINTFSNKRGQEECQLCPEGSVSERGAKRCTACPKGQTPPVEEIIFPQSFSLNKCVNARTHCPPGSERVLRKFFDDETFCRRKVCSSDAPAQDIGKTCTPCAKGTFLDETGRKPRCRACEDDEVSKGGLQTKCTKCTNGFVRDPRDGSRCSCKGFAAKGKGIQNGKCEKCPPATQSESSSRSEDFTCNPCPPGTFKPVFYEPFPELANCIDCPLNTFSTGGALECTPCPSGFVTKRNGATSRKSCIRF